MSKHPTTPGFAESAASLLDPADDAPDLSTPEWIARFATVKVQRGRPLSAQTKVSTTLRLDPDVIAAFKADGPGWQSRMNDALRPAAGLAAR